MNSANEDVIIDILQRCFPRATNIRIIEKAEKNDGLHFTSEIIQVTIEYRDSSPQKRYLILKFPSSGPAFNFYSKSQAYIKETLTYDQMLPRVNDLLPRRITPTHYFTTESNILVMEDLAKHGYTVGEKHSFIDFQQSMTILQTLAQFHAATFKIRGQSSTILNDAAFESSLAINERLVFVDPWLSVIETLLLRKNEVDLIPKVKKAVDALQVENAILYTWVRKQLKFVVLNHGDYRKVNLLLKYDSGNRVEDVKVIDFQTCWWSSPVYDFIMYIVFSVRIEVVEEHFETLVQSYVDYLKTAMAELECSGSYHKTDFIDDLRIFHFHIMAVLLAHCTFCSPLGSNSQMKTFILKNETNENFHEECLNDETFATSLYRWLKFSEKLGVFDSVDQWFK